MRDVLGFPERMNDLINKSSTAVIWNKSLRDIRSTVTGKARLFAGALLHLIGRRWSRCVYFIRFFASPPDHWSTFREDEG